jgi:hypothetical protein
MGRFKKKVILFTREEYMLHVIPLFGGPPPPPQPTKTKKKKKKKKIIII